MTPLAKLADSSHELLAEAELLRCEARLMQQRSDPYGPMWRCVISPWVVGFHGWEMDHSDGIGGGISRILSDSVRRTKEIARELRRRSDALRDDIAG